MRIKAVDVDKNGYCYRNAKNEDYSIIADLLSSEFGISLSYDNFVKLLAIEDILFIVALDDGVCFGFISSEIQNDYFSGRKRMFIKYGAVRSEYRNKGVYKHLVETIKNKAIEEKASSIELTCAMHRSESHKFYFNNGFTIKKTFVFINELK